MAVDAAGILRADLDNNLVDNLVDSC